MEKFLKIKTVLSFTVAVLLTFLALPASSALAQSGSQAFDSFSFSGADAGVMPYRLHTPSLDNSNASPLPLIIYLHGSGGAGTNNVKQISGGNSHGTGLWLKPEIAKENPAFVLAPQIPRGQRWDAMGSDELSTSAELLLQLIQSIQSEYPIDSRRIYILGQSLGGMGVWDIVAKRPDVFAAGVPICGVGNSDRIVNAKDIPLWAFHGDEDTTVPVSGSRTMVEELRAAGSSTKYTEYAGVGHNSWESAFAEPDLATWLFSHSK